LTVPNGKVGNVLDPVLENLAGKAPFDVTNPITSDR
jgi:hypothetical protein